MFRLHLWSLLVKFVYLKNVMLFVPINAFAHYRLTCWSRMLLFVLDFLCRSSILVCDEGSETKSFRWKIERVLNNYLSKNITFKFIGFTQLRCYQTFIYLIAKMDSVSMLLTMSNTKYCLFSIGIQIMAASFRPDLFFKADHPFVFSLHDTSSSLFIGRIQNF